MSDLRDQFLAMLGDAPVNGNVSEPATDTAPTQAPPAGNDRLDRIEAAIEKLAAPTPAASVASIVNRPNPNPNSDGGAYGMTPTLESDDQPIWKWSQSHIDKYVHQHGLREFANMAKQRLNKDLRGVRFTIPRGGK